MSDRILTLPVKTKYFNEIKNGTKVLEYRENTTHWRKRIVGKEFDYVEITLGYPKKEDQTRRMRFPWRGYEEQTISHEIFDGFERDVFAIHVGNSTPQTLKGQ